jgi:triosephosphate isomerase
MAKPLIAGNWKMHGTAAEAAALSRQLVKNEQSFAGVQMAIFPPTLHLGLVASELSGSSIALGAQNMSEHRSGAFTGEVSADMLKEVGCSYTLVGHSERRTLFGEVGSTVADKFKVAQKTGLVPILCVGETLQQRQQGLTLEVVAEQINVVKEKVGIESLCRGVIAYEPVWAIGTGEVASPEQAQLVHGAIRELLGSSGIGTSLLYGGSVKASNAVELFAQRDIDGGLVGGASLEADEFLKIAQLMT